MESIRLVARNGEAVRQALERGEVLHLDTGAHLERGGSQLAFSAGIDRNIPRMRLARLSGCDRQPRHGANGRQCLAAETKRSDVEQIVFRKLRRGMALDGKRQIMRPHTDAVIGDADQSTAAAVGQDIDARGLGVDGILDQLLDHGGGALDHLAGRNAIDQRSG